MEVSLHPFEKDRIMDPVFTFFSKNLATVSKEQLLEALENALRSADYWREACLGVSNPEPLTILPEEY